MFALGKGPESTQVLQDSVGFSGLVLRSKKRHQFCQEEFGYDITQITSNDPKIKYLWAELICLKWWNAKISDHRTSKRGGFLRVINHVNCIWDIPYYDPHFSCKAFYPIHGLPWIWGADDVALARRRSWSLHGSHVASEPCVEPTNEAQVPWVKSKPWRADGSLGEWGKKQDPELSSGGILRPYKSIDVSDDIRLRNSISFLSKFFSFPEAGEGPKIAWQRHVRLVSEGRFNRMQGDGLKEKLPNNPYTNCIHLAILNLFQLQEWQPQLPETQQKQRPQTTSWQGDPLYFWYPALKLSTKIQICDWRAANL